MKSSARAARGTDGVTEAGEAGRPYALLADGATMTIRSATPGDYQAADAVSTYAVADRLQPGAVRSAAVQAGPSTVGRPCRRARTSRPIRARPWIMIRVLTTAASVPVAAWVPLTKLYSPCQRATSKMLPPDRL